MNPKVKRFELLELLVPANATGQVRFPTNAQLRNQANQMIIVKGVEVYPDTVYANSQTTNAVIGMPSAEVPKAVLVLYVNGEESVKMIPLAKLINVNDGGTTPFQEQITGFDDLTDIDWDSSYVQFSSAASGTTYVIPFGIIYIRLRRDPSDPGKWINA